MDNGLNAAMLMLAQDVHVIFLGQNVCYDGNVMFKDFEGIPMERRLEMPVAEETQMGMSIGMSLMGYVPVSVYPRMDFLMRAMDQLVNHLDKLAIMSQGQYVPKIIIRTKVGARKPLDAGPQHTQDHTEALALMCRNISIVKLISANVAVSVYRDALQRRGSSLIIEDIK